MLSNKIVFLPKRIGETNNSKANISKAKKILGWMPKVSFEELVSKMLNHDMKMMHS